MDKMATYKGRTYRLRFLGDTKFGRRAKLAFLDGSKEFWVDASLVAEAESPAKQTYEAGRTETRGKYRGGRAVCADCGRPGYLVQDLEDGLMKHRRCCDMEP